MRGPKWLEELRRSRIRAVPPVPPAPPDALRCRLDGMAMAGEALGCLDSSDPGDVLHAIAEALVMPSDVCKAARLEAVRTLIATYEATL